MPDPITPAAPSIPAASIVSDIPVATPTTAAPTPPPQPRDDKGKFAKPPPAPPSRKAGALSARAALGLKEDPSKTAQGIVDKAVKSFERVEYKEGTEPAAPAVPAAVQPAAPAAPVVTPPSAPAAPAPEKTVVKVKFGDKELTPEEATAKLAELEQKANAATPPASSAPAPAAPAAPALTPEQIAAQQAQIKQQETKWIAETAAQMEAPITEAELNEILDGGPKAVALFQKLRQQDMANAMLNAQKNIANNLNPILEKFSSMLAPVLQHHDSIARYQVTQQFVAKHPDFKPHLDLATQVAEELQARYPQQVNSLTAEQFIDEVARQTGAMLDANWKRFNPTATGTWRDVAKAAPAAPAAVPALSAAPAAPVVTPTPAPIPSAAALPPGAPPVVTAGLKIKPPVGAVPTNAPPALQPSWQKAVASSMRGGRGR
jgi:hypothetical protein